MNKTSHKDASLVDAATDEIMNVTIHDIKQPLNVIRLACGNIRARLTSRMPEDDAAYLSNKLDRIEHQIERAAELLDALKNPAPEKGAG